MVSTNFGAFKAFFSNFLSVEDANNGQSFDSVFNNVVVVKKIFINYHGPHGQIRLFQNANSKISDFEEQCTALIHSHFAQLSGEKKLILKNDGGQDHIWQPCSEFPFVSNDVLLYLLLMGGKINGRLAPYVYFLLNIVSTVDHHKLMLDLSYVVLKNNDGNFLQSLLSTTVCLSSLCDGIEGILLERFLLNLIFQLQNTPLNPNAVTIFGLEKLKVRTEMNIPFLSPPNMIWPEYLIEIPDSIFGNLESARNKDRIDLLTDNIIAGESKDYGNIIKLLEILCMTRFCDEKNNY
jgi:hypothetical protein